MTGSASNNLTTQWTFRDGRDYVLSLTTTEVPNTVSFWISDKITGEEWTGCYDENCIEVITKRTGCFKSFHTFLAMIKSALLKKSESVILEFLNMQDLAAISIHRQLSTTSTTPLNFELFNTDVTANSDMRQQTKPQKVSSADTNANHGGDGITGSNKPPPQSSLSKRKYLIVSYIGEFDKVHYPLPLNYSNPPDLNVMQNNIIKLKAEVTSLKTAKKELEEHLESIKLSDRIPQHSHENKNDVNMIISQPLASNSTTTGMMKKKEQVLFDQQQQNIISLQKAEFKDLNKNDVLVERPNLSNIKDELGNFVDESTAIVSPTCIKCSATIEKLTARVHVLENAVIAQRDEFVENMEKLEKENHFLRLKVDTSEKYEIDLWSQISSLKEKVEMMKNSAAEKERGSMKDVGKNRYRQSRHDLFYSTKPIRKLPNISSPRTLTNISPARKLHSRINWKSDFTERGKYGQIHSRSRSNSNSTASYSSVIGEGRTCNDNVGRKSRVECKKDFCRSRSSSSYNSIRFLSNNLLQKSRSVSVSPGRRFDPTAYITDKKMKQSKIANLRLQKIESHIRTASADSPIHIQRSPSAGKNSRPTTPLTKTTVSPSALHRLLGSLSGEKDAGKNLKMNKKISVKDISSNKNVSNTNKSLKDRFERKSTFDTSRPVSADSYRTRIISKSPQFSFDENKLAKKIKTDKTDLGKKALQTKLPKSSMRKGNSLDMPTFTSELKDRLVRTPTKKALPNKRSKPKPNTNSVAINTSFTYDQLDSLVSISDENLKHHNSQSTKRQNEKKDIISLQEKLSSLHAFLETCK